MASSVAALIFALFVLQGCARRHSLDLSLEALDTGASRTSSGREETAQNDGERAEQEIVEDEKAEGEVEEDDEERVDEEEEEIAEQKELVEGANATALVEQGDKVNMTMMGRPWNCPSNGQWDTCSEQCLCPAGWGDCDRDSQCMPGLYCQQGSGKDVCVQASGGMMGGMHGGMTGGMHGGMHGGNMQGGRPWNCPPNGQWDTCSAQCPCPAGWGDCDSNSQCMPGLYCQQGSGKDVCVQGSGGMMGGMHGGMTGGMHGGMHGGMSQGGRPWNCPSNGQWDTCSEQCLCPAGWGDCDRDSQCMPGHYCQQGSGKDVCVQGSGGMMGGGMHGGMMGGGMQMGRPSGCPENGLWDTCSIRCKCPAGWGDCDSDSQCLPGLRCQQSWGKDVCVR